MAKSVAVGTWAPDDFTKDSWAVAVSIGTFTVAEMFIAVFGACSPSLKGPIERLLARWGILLDKGETVDFINVGEGGRRERPVRVSCDEESIGRSRPVRFGGEEGDGKAESTDEMGSASMSGSGEERRTR